MINDIHFVWQEVIADISTPAALWQLVIIVVALGLAWAVNGALRATVMRNAPESWKIGIGISHKNIGMHNISLGNYTLAAKHFITAGILHLPSICN